MARTLDRRFTLWTGLTLLGVVALTGCRSGDYFSDTGYRLRDTSYSAGRIKAQVQNDWELFPARMATLGDALGFSFESAGPALKRTWYLYTEGAPRGPDPKLNKQLLRQDVTTRSKPLPQGKPDPKP